MKAERKHETETHEDLAGSMNDLGRLLQENATTLLTGVGVVLVAALGYQLIFSERPIDAPAGDWSKFILAISDREPEKELQVLVEDATDERSPPVVQAKISLGERQLAEGVRQLFSDRKQAADLLEKSRKNLEDADAAAQDALTRNRARLALAALAESQNKPDEALRYYELVAKTSGPESMLGGFARAEQKRMAGAEGRDFLAWFEKQTPVSRTPGMGSPLDPNFRMPDMQDFKVPAAPKSVPEPEPFIPALPAVSDESDPLGLIPSEKPKTDDKPKSEDPLKTDDKPKTEDPSATPSDKASDAKSPEAPTGEAKKDAPAAVEAADGAGSGK